MTRFPRLYEELTGLSFHPETLDTLAERERERLKTIAASGMKGCVKARKRLSELKHQDLRGARHV